jgi:hypothetical protein
MTTWPTAHLTGDDLDALHSEACSAEVKLHLETCDACRSLADSDHALLTALEQLQPYDVPPSFVDRVMERVVVLDPAPVPVLSFPALNRPRRVGLLAVAAAMFLSVVWAATNRTVLDTWLTSITAELTRVGWLTLRAAAATIADQPRVESLEGTWFTPLRIAGLAVAGALAYGSGLFALRRLLTPSAGPVSNANA